ncbi:cutinase family protein [Mycobacterium sp.]|uniref:cutinase family protein n=1 Tax=Mycobacterium sp. TaxID=1785 RepID=UPI001282D96A|nr:cutinase family protein [Mycobacterium sp.]KAA8969508.1 MAG: cutinase family protein [Mycobacterium sp.]
MHPAKIARILAVAAAASTLPSPPIAIAPAVADPCPFAEVVFARGTGEPPGVGGTGEAFIDALRAQVPGRTIEVYPVNYPASPDYRASATAGAEDASAHVEGTVAHCPNTHVVLGGYSQGAAVIDFATESMPARVADHVAAVALFGNPSSAYASSLMGGPLPTLAPAYRAKSIDLCTPEDIICAENGNMVAHLLYVQDGMANDAAAFVASRL